MCPPRLLPPLPATSQHETGLITQLFAIVQAEKREYATFLATRPKQFEEDAIRMLLLQLKRVEDAAALVKSDPPTGWGLHIVHLGHAGMLPEIAAAKAAGAPLDHAIFTPIEAEVNCVYTCSSPGGD